MHASSLTLASRNRRNERQKPESKGGSKRDEKMATNILANRLEHVKGEVLSSKSPRPHEKRKEYYVVTELCIPLVLMFIEMVAWSANNETWQILEHNGTRDRALFV